MVELIKYGKWIVIIIIALLAIFKIWGYYHDKNFVKNNFIKYTQCREFIEKYEYFDNHQSYIEVTISKIDKENLLTKFNFDNSLIKLKGRVECPFISEIPNYIYYIIEEGYGPYGYILFALEREGIYILTLNSPDVSGLIFNFQFLYPTFANKNQLAVCKLPIANCQFRKCPAINP